MIQQSSIWNEEIAARRNRLDCKISLTILIMLLALLSSVLAFPKQITVAKDGSGDYQTIQAAIDAASSGDTVYVKAGTYEEHIDFESGITLQGAGRDVSTIRYSGDNAVITAKDVTSGTIDGLSIEYHSELQRSLLEHSVLIIAFSSIKVSNNILKGATSAGIEVRGKANPFIENNYIYDNDGSGISIYRATEGAIQANKIYENACHGVEVIEGAAALLESNFIWSNGYSGVRVNKWSSADIRDNQIFLNRQHGVHLIEPSNTCLQNNTIVLNQRDGIFAYGDTALTVKNNIIVKNGADGIDVNLYRHTSARAVMFHNDVWGNSDLDYEGMSIPSADISVDPQFVDLDEHDFRLRPSSPCIGVGEKGSNLGAYFNQSPVARFSVSVTACKVWELVEFKATDSLDLDGFIQEYVWDFGDGATGSGSSTSHIYRKAGTYVVTLTVTDDDGATASTSQTINVAGAPPMSDFTITPDAPSLFEEVQFHDQSTDKYGDVVSWEWDFGDGTTSTEQDPTHRYQQKGTFTITLTVTDNDGLTDQTTQTIVVHREDLIQADFTFDVLDRELHKVHLDASLSIGTMGNIVRYEWDWDGDGVYDTAVYDPQMTHRFDGKEPYKVILTIVDDQGNRASCTKEVDI